MSEARLTITAVVLEGRTKSEVARVYDVSRFWVHQVVTRYRAEGEAAFEPRSRRPHASPQAVSAETEDQIVRLRKELARQGLDAGADTIRTHLARRTPRSKTSTSRDPVPAVSTIWRILTRRGFVTSQPQKRPRSSWQRFAAEQEIPWAPTAPRRAREIKRTDRRYCSRANPESQPCDQRPRPG